LNDDAPLPPASIVVMQASLYQFLPDAAGIVSRMFAAAQKQVVIAEPVRNLSSSRFALLAALARRHADAGLGAVPHRFTSGSLASFFASLSLEPRRKFAIPGGREEVYLFDRLREQAGRSAH
jgi:hypothetical protein